MLKVIRRGRDKATVMAMTAGLIFLAAMETVRAQSALGIAATVNDEMISVLDIEARMTLAIYLSKLADNGETRRRMAPQILRGIIDDKLKLQDIRRQNIEISQEEIVRGLRDWEKRTGLSKGESTALAKRLGIDKSAIAERVEINVGWRKLLRDRFLPTIAFSDEEIDDIVAEEVSRRGQPEYRVSEIFLPFSKDAEKADVRAFADRLIAQVSRGAAFSAIARNFSQSPTAGLGGDLGWVRQGALAAELNDLLKRLRPGQISQPVETFDGIYIIKLFDMRAIEPLIERSNKPATVTIHQIHLELPPAPNPAALAAAQDRVRKISATAKSCKDMDELGKRYGSSLSGSPGKIAVDQLSNQLRKAITGLPKFQVSAPIEIAGGLLVVMVCDRVEPKSRKLTQQQLRDRIVNRLINDRVNLGASQHLRNLRRSAVVDIRL